MDCRAHRRQPSVCGVSAQGAAPEGGTSGQRLIDGDKADHNALDGAFQVARKATAFIAWFPGDFLSSTRGWPVTARGVYRELIDSQWDLGALPDDPAALRRLIGATPKEWQWWSTHVEPKFPIGPDGMRRNLRLEQHRERALRISKVRAEAGREGGKARG